MKKIFAIFVIFVSSFMFVGCGKEPVISGLLDYYIVYEGETSEPIFFKIDKAPEHYVDFQSLNLENLEIIDNKLVGLKAGPAELQVTVKNSKIKKIIPVYVVSPYSYIFHSDEVTITEYLGSNKEELIIPEKVFVRYENGFEYKTVTAIKDYFYTKNEYEFISVTLPKTIRNIGRYAFANNDTLEEIVIPFDIELQEFSEGVFSNVSNLSTINIPNKLLYINASAFKGTNIDDFVIEDNELFVYTNNLLIDYNTTSGNGIVIYANPFSSNFIVPDNVTSIVAYVFLNHKNIKTINLNNVTFVGTEAFKNSTLKNVISNLEFKFDKDAFLNTPYYDNLIN